MHQVVSRLRIVAHLFPLTTTQMAKPLLHLLFGSQVKFPYLNDWAWLWLLYRSTLCIHIHRRYTEYFCLILVVPVTVFRCNGSWEDMVQKVICARHHSCSAHCCSPSRKCFHFQRHQKGKVCVICVYLYVSVLNYVCKYGARG